MHNGEGSTTLYLKANPVPKSHVTLLWIFGEGWSTLYFGVGYFIVAVWGGVNNNLPELQVTLFWLFGEGWSILYIRVAYFIFALWELGRDGSSRSQTPGYLIVAFWGRVEHPVPRSWLLYCCSLGRGGQSFT